MNTSGGPISKLCREYKIKAEELLVIHDELDIPAGDVRVKVGGRAMPVTTACVPSSIRWAAATSAASAPASATLPARWPSPTTCLSSWRAREAEDFQDTCARAADAAGLAIVHGVVYARDHVNGAASANGKH